MLAKRSFRIYMPVGELGRALSEEYLVELLDLIHGYMAPEMSAVHTQDIHEYLQKAARSQVGFRDFLKDKKYIVEDTSFRELAERYSHMAGLSSGGNNMTSIDFIVDSGETIDEVMARVAALAHSGALPSLKVRTSND